MAFQTVDFDYVIPKRDALASHFALLLWGVDIYLSLSPARCAGLSHYAPSSGRTALV